MEAGRILSEEQRHALELIRTFLRGATAFLESAEMPNPDDRLVAANLCELADVAMRRLIEAFPELLADWGGR